jgi:GGDEF domain-containing protein
VSRRFEEEGETNLAPASLVDMTAERILLIGDTEQELQPALSAALPAAQITSVATVFDGIAELVADTYTTIIATAEPIERRPESAVKALREVAGQSRLLLFGHPTLEPLSRKMLQFGADDYLVTPANTVDLQQIFGAAPLRLTPQAPAQDSPHAEPLSPTPPTKLSQLLGLPLAEVMLDAMWAQPSDGPNQVIAQLNARIGPTMKLIYQPKNPTAPAEPEGSIAIQSNVRSADGDAGMLHLLLPRDEDETAGRHFLGQIAHLLGKVISIQDRHNRLQKLAITDDLTGLYNGRYFRHFLTRVIERARGMLFPVTLLLFDIDNFKQYNDRYGHGVGDEILKQTAVLMKRCVRDHDLVARISGDEFAVVFWEKDGPRKPLDPKTGQPIPVVGPTRPPQTPVQIFERFQRLMATQHFEGLGPHGKGTLTISGGAAVFPYHAHNVEDLIDAADKALMFGAKQSGKNSIFLIGGGEQFYPPPPAE